MLTEMTANHPGACQGEYCPDATCATCTWGKVHKLAPRLTSGQIWSLILGANIDGTFARHGITVTRTPAGYVVRR